MLTDITVLLDRSGSMSAIRDEVIGGLNGFVEQQQKLDGEARFTLVQFDSVNAYEVIIDNQDMKRVRILEKDDLIPRGTTPLLDAIGKTFGSVRSRLALTKDQYKPDKVVVAIVTDGLENASKEMSGDVVTQLIANARSDGWEVTFLAANQDAIQTGADLGIPRASSLTYDPNVKGATAAGFAAFTSNVSQVRSGGTVNYSDTERSASIGDLGEDDEV